MILLDVNVLLAAHRDDHPHHHLVHPWLEALAGGGEPFIVPDFVWASFVRLATNRRIFTIPTPLADAFAFLRALRGQANHVALHPGEGHLGIFENLCRDADAAGDLAPDAYLAAIAVEHACVLVSLDRDFARFAGVTWRRPGE